MKIICAVLLAVIYSFEIQAQTNFYNQSHLNLPAMKLKNSAGKSKESTYHLGLDYSYGINESERYDYIEHEFHELRGYYDINIGEKILYFRLETGLMSDWKFKWGAVFATLGVNYRIKKFDRHIIYLLFGLEGWTNLYSAGLFAVINPKYVFMLSRGFGLSAGVRFMPWITFKPIELGEGFVNISTGVQFFY